MTSEFLFGNYIVAGISNYYIQMKFIKWIICLTTVLIAFSNAEERSSISGPHLEFIKKTAKKSKIVLVLCPFRQTLDESESPFLQLKIDCVVVKTLKGEVEFGKKIQVLKIIEKKTTSFELGTLRILIFDSLNNDEALAETGQFPVYSKALEAALKNINSN